MRDILFLHLEEEKKKKDIYRLVREGIYITSSKVKHHTLHVVFLQFFGQNQHVGRLRDSTTGQM